jgi:hypothetical protein
MIYEGTGKADWRLHLQKRDAKREGGLGPEAMSSMIRDEEWGNVVMKKIKEKKEVA